MRFRHRAQQALCYQLQHRLFAHRQAGQIRTLEVAGRDHRMMVGYFLVVDDRTGIAGNGDPFPKRHGLGNQIDQHRQAFSHIARQIAAVCSGIGDELLFIKALCIVQGLLCGETQPPEEAKEIPQVAGSLEEALNELDLDREFLKAGGVFTDEAIDAYIALRREEDDRVRMTPHPVEFELYYSV